MYTVGIHNKFASSAQADKYGGVKIFYCKCCTVQAEEAEVELNNGHFGIATGK